MPEDSQYETEDCWKQLCSLQAAIENTNENGLFKNDESSYRKLVDNVTDAFSDLEKKSVIEARKKFSYGWFELNHFIDSTSIGWRLKYLYCLPIFLYYLSTFLVLLSLWFLVQPTITTYKLFWIPSWAFIWGIIGSLLYGFWWLRQNVSYKQFRKVWYVWYLSLPVMGGLFGAITYLAYYAGFIAATGVSSVSIANDTNFLAMLLSALAGFSSKWTISLLESVQHIVKIGGGGE